MRLSFVLSVILYSLCTWLVWADLKSGRAEPNTPVEFSGFYHYVSSDALYGPALFRDLFLENISTRGWTLPPAPYFFPDLAIYFPILAFFKQPLAAFLAGTIFFTLSLLAAGYFLQTAFPKQNNVFESIFLTGSVLLLLIVKDFLPASFHGLIVPTFHHGATICAFLAFTLILKSLFEPGAGFYLALLFILSWVSMLSDSVYAALVVPGVLIYLGLSDVTRVRKVCSAIAIGFGILMGRWSVRWTNDFGNLRIVTIAPERDVLSGLTHWSWNHLHDFLTPWYIIAIGVAILGILVGIRFNRQPERLAWLLPSTGILSILFAANVFGPQVGIETMQDRYVLFAVFSACVWICFQVSKWSVIRILAPVLLIGITVIGIAKVGKYNEHPIFSATRCLKELTHSANLKYGIADYWYAKPYTILSEREVRLNEVDLTLGPRPWINNIDRFFTPTGVPAYDYLIANNLPTDFILQRLGPPTRIQTCGYLHIWIYDPNQNPKLANLFTRSQMQIWRQAIGR